MKVTYYALAFMIFITTMVGIVQLLGYSPQPMTPYDPENMADSLDPENVIGSIDPED